jgi:hypothetical protein
VVIRISRGFSLSRGLTLEGLMVSYFLRNSMMYDTLMQMGRWFGYRPGYDDLCRVWMLEEAEGWYSHIAESIEELRDELRRMEAVNATPEQFGLKVRSHPDTLIVTARNKMGSSEKHVVSIGLANRFIETAILRRDQAALQANRSAALALADALRAIGKAPEAAETRGGSRLVQQVPGSIILDFLAVFQNHPGSFLTDTDPVRRYIEERIDGELKEWDVLVAGVERGDDRPLVDRSLGFDLICQRRSKGKKSDERTLLVTEKQRVASRGVEKTGLTDDEIREAEEGYVPKSGARTEGKPLNFPDRVYRDVRKRPLFILHMLAIGGKDEDLAATEPVVAWSISFPKTGLEEKKVGYVVNTTWFRERYTEEEVEEEAAGDEE